METETEQETVDYEVHLAISLLASVKADGTYTLGAPGPADGSVLFSDAEEGAWCEERDSWERPGDGPDELPDAAWWEALAKLGQAATSLAGRDKLQAEWVDARARHQACFHETGHPRTVAELAKLDYAARQREVDWQRSLAFLDGRARGLRDALDILAGNWQVDA